MNKLNILFLSLYYMDSNYEKLFQELETNLKKNYKKYGIDFKLKVINLVNLNISIHSISNRLRIGRKAIENRQIIHLLYLI